MMKRAKLTLSALLAIGMIAREPNAPIAIDWHTGGHLCVLYNSGNATITDEKGRRKLLMIRPVENLQPVEIVAAQLHGIEYVFISGFIGRIGTIIQYTNTGRKVATYETPQQAVSFDIDPGTRRLYLASAVTNGIYTIDLDRPTPERLGVIKEAQSIGPVLFDQQRQRLIVADSGYGKTYDVDRKGNYQTTATDLGRPIGLAFDTSGTILYILDASTGNIITKHDKRTNTTQTGLQNLTAIATGPNSTIYLADKKKGLYQLDTATKRLTQLTGI